MKFSLSFLLLVFLADKLNQACGTPGSVMIESLRRRSANGERPSLRGEQCTAPVSGLCLDVKWMFGIEGWNEGFDLLRISLGMEFP